MFYATLRDLVLYLHKDEGGVKDSQPAALHNMTNAIRVHHSLAMKATEYKKKQYVFRLRTADGAEYLFQTGYVQVCNMMKNDPCSCRWNKMQFCIVANAIWS